MPLIHTRFQPGDQDAPSSCLQNRFNGFHHPHKEKPLKRLGKSIGMAPVTRLKPGENESAIYESPASRRWTFSLGFDRLSALRNHMKFLKGRSNDSRATSDSTTNASPLVRHT